MGVKEEVDYNMELSAANKATEDGRAAMQNREDLFDLKALGQKVKEATVGKEEEGEEKEDADAYWLAWASICETIASNTGNSDYLKWSDDLSTPQDRANLKTVFSNALFRFGKNSIPFYVSRLIQNCLNQQYLSRSQLDEIMFKTMVFSCATAVEQEQNDDDDEDANNEKVAKLELRPFLSFFNLHKTLAQPELYCCFTNQELTALMESKDLQKRFELCAKQKHQSYRPRLDYQYTFTVDSVISKNNYYHYYNHWLFERIKDFNITRLTFDEGTFCCRLLFRLAEVIESFTFVTKGHVEAFLDVCRSLQQLPNGDEMVVDENDGLALAPEAMWTWLCSEKDMFEKSTEEVLDASLEEIPTFDTRDYERYEKLAAGENFIDVSDGFFGKSLTTLLIDVNGKVWSELWNLVSQEYDYEISTRAEKEYERHRQMLTLEPRPFKVAENKTIVSEKGVVLSDDVVEKLKEDGFIQYVMTKMLFLKQKYDKTRKEFESDQAAFKRKYVSFFEKERKDELRIPSPETHLLMLDIDGVEKRIPGRFSDDNSSYNYSGELIPALPFTYEVDEDGNPVYYVDEKGENLQKKVLTKLIVREFFFAEEAVSVIADFANSGLYNEDLPIEKERDFLESSHPFHDKDDKWQEYITEMQEKPRFASYIQTKKLFTKKMATFWMNRPIDADNPEEEDILQVPTVFKDEEAEIYDMNSNVLLCWPNKSVAEEDQTQSSNFNLLERLFDALVQFVDENVQTPKYWKFVYAVDELRNLLMLKHVNVDDAQVMAFYQRKFNADNYVEIDPDPDSNVRQEAVPSIQRTNIRNAVSTIAKEVHSDTETNFGRDFMSLITRLPTCEPIKRLLEHPFFMLKYTHAVIKDGLTGNYYFLFNSETAFEFIVQYKKDDKVFDFVEYEDAIEDDDALPQYELWHQRLTQFAQPEMASVDDGRVATNDNIEDEDLFWERVPATNIEIADKMNISDDDKMEMVAEDQEIEEAKAWFKQLKKEDVLKWGTANVYIYHQLLDQPNTEILEMWLKENDEDELMVYVKQKYRGACTFVYHKPLAAAHLCVESEALTSAPPPAQSEGRKRGLSDAEIDKEEGNCVQTSTQNIYQHTLTVYARIMRNDMPDSSPLYALKQRMLRANEAAALNELMENQELLEELMRVTKRRTAQLMLLLL